MRAIAVGAISITILILASTVTVRLAMGQADSVCVTGTAVATSTPSLIVDAIHFSKSSQTFAAPLSLTGGRVVRLSNGMAL